MRAEVISISSQHLDRPTLHEFCTKGRRIRNGANYIKRKAYYEHDKYQIDCNDIDRAVKGHIDTDEVKFIIDNYPKEIEVIRKHAQGLSSACIQSIIQGLGDEWVNYKKALDSYKANPSKFKASPGVPGYAKKDITIVLQKNGFKIEDNTFVISKLKFKSPIKVRCHDNQKYNQKAGTSKVQEVRIKPCSGNNFEIHLAYEEEKKQDKRTEQLDKNNYMAIDLGVSNLATIVAVSKTEKLHPILIKGGALKSFNAKYNKHVAFLKSKKKYKTKSKIDYNRETKFRDAFHQISHLIIEYALDHHIGNIVIGHNQQWKQNINIGKVNNQAFCFIPYKKLIDYITYKGQEVGINVETSDESYTSKASALDLDDIPTYVEGDKNHYTFSGVRKYRGLYYSKVSGIYLNADVNGALNILRKKYGNECIESIVKDAVYTKGVLNTPEVVKLPNRS